MQSSVTLGEWLRHHKMDWRSGLCVNIATDGLNSSSNHLLAVGMQFPGEEPFYVYVRGGFPGDTEQYHGIIFEHYRNKWVAPKRAQEILREIVPEAQFLVVGNRSFFEQWLLLSEPPLSAFGDYPIFGLTDYIKFLDGGDRLYLTTGETMEDVTALIRNNVRDMRYKGGYSVRSLYSRIVGQPSEEEGVIFEHRTKELTRLFCSMLWA